MGMFGKAAKAAGRSIARDVKEAATPKVVKATSQQIKAAAAANAQRQANRKRRGFVGF